ncbi:MAG: DUF4149 domain-containing protein [Acidobacteriaceae bacterium]|nr:DUF4149 domain-containing protein [Acidobacteriaceae bacterium]
MRTLLNVVALLALAVWFGALVFFGVLAQTAFTVLPPLFADQPQGFHAAGLVVGTALGRLHYLGLICGIVFLLATFALGRAERFKTLLPQIGLAAVMLLLTMYSQFSIIPRMNTARASVGGVVEAVPHDNPGYQVFQNLHLQSTRVEGGVLLCGLLAFCFAVRAAEMQARVAR